MAEINLGKRVVLIPGARIERVHNEYSAYKVHVTSMSFWPTDTLTKPTTHTHLLPHLHLRFRATDWWDIRFSYNNTLSRPDYNYAIPLVWYHTSQSRGTAGNPFIAPALSENLDANFTFYARKLGLITIGGFYKTVSDMFYEQETIVENIPEPGIVDEFPLETYPSIGTSTTNFYVNSPYEGTIKGIEAEWQSNFNWLSGAWSGLVLNANYTHVWSDTKYMLHRILFVIPEGGWLPEPVEADTFFNNRLLHQADDIANVSMGYDYKGFSARLSFRYQGNVVSSIRSLPQLNGYSAPQYKFDLVIKQRIPVKFADLELFLNAINFTNVPRESFIDYPNGRQTTSVSYTGAQFQLGIRLRN
jgi:TonB-dependent receptor